MKCRNRWIDNTQYYYVPQKGSRSCRASYVSTAIWAHYRLRLLSTSILTFNGPKTNDNHGFRWYSVKWNFEIGGCNPSLLCSIWLCSWRTATTWAFLGHIIMGVLSIRFRNFMEKSRKYGFRWNSDNEILKSNGCNTQSIMYVPSERLT